MSPFNLKLPVAIGCDHAGFDCKEDLISFLEGEGVVFKDFQWTIPILLIPLPALLKKAKLLLEYYFVGVPTEWLSQLINTRAYGPLFAGEKNWQSLPVNTMMLI